MSDVLIPPWIIPEEESHEWLDEGSAVFRAAFAPGLSQSQSYGGLRLKLSRRHTVRLEEKAQLLSILRSTRGSYNALRTKVHFALRGSFPATELLTNNTFANGTTGWSADTRATLTVADRILRVTRSMVDGSECHISGPTATVVQYAPYALRGHWVQGQGGFTSAGPSFISTGAAQYGSAITPLFGLKKYAVVPLTTSLQFELVDAQPSGQIQGDYFCVPYVSLSRCALVDNAPNLALQSSTFQTSWTLSNTTLDVNLVNAPDMSATADYLKETAVTNTFSIFQSGTSIASAAADYSFSLFVKAGGRNWCYLGLQEQTGATSINAYFGLAAGTVGTTSTGANWSNPRTFITSFGDGWYRCTIVGRKTNAATSLLANIGIASADNTPSYAGNSSLGIAIWGASVAQSSVPVRLGQTTTAATSGAAQTGTAIFLKGLPASTSGLLLPEDMIEINGELKTCTAALNSDSAGMGYLQFEPALVRSPSDNDAVVILDPMGKFLISNIKIDNEFGTQARVSYDLEHIYE